MILARADVSDDVVLGVDVGSYSTKGVLCTPAGTVIASRVIEHGLSVPRPGWAEHDADAVWWADCAAICRDVLRASGRRPGTVRAVSVSAIGPAVVPIDGRGRPLRPAILYGIDARAAHEIDELTVRFGERDLLAACGSVLTTQAIGPKILWLRRHEPDIVARTASFLGATSYLVYRLTGEMVMDRYTASSYTPLYDLRAGGWSEQFAGPICSLGQLPPIRGSTEVVGTVTPRAAAETGLPVGTPVTAGTIDAMAESISVGAVRPGDVMIMYGTTTFFIFVTPSLLIDRRFWAYSHALPDRYTLAAGVSTTGALTRWMRDMVAPDLIAAQQRGGVDAYRELEQEAAAVEPGSMGLVMLPYFSGERTPINDPLARGVVAGLTLAHTRGHLYRAALEGVAYGVRHNLDTLREAGARAARLVAVGGGTRSRLWLDIVSSVSGAPQDVPAQTIGASYGDAFLAALAVGLVADVSALDKAWVHIAERVEPDPAAQRTYDGYYPLYRDLYRATRKHQHRLSMLADASRAR